MSGKHLFFELTRLSCGTGEARLSRNPSPDEWAAIHKEAFRQTMAGVLFAVIERLPAEQRPPRGLLLQWFAAKERIVASNRLLNIRAVEACRLFGRDGFRSVVLKGQGLSLLYPDPLLRQPGDIDIWLDGSRKRISEYGRRRFPSVPVRYHHMDFPVFADVAVEVHFIPSWMNRYDSHRRLRHFFRTEAERQFRHYVQLPGDAGEVAVPTLSFNRIYLLVHIYRHLFGEGIGLRQMQDYCFVLRQGTTAEERQETMEVLGRLRMVRFARSVMYVLQEVFGLPAEYFLCEPDICAGRFLLSEIMQAGNFGKYDARLQRRPDETAAYRFRRSLRRNVRFLRYYPSEVLCDPVFKIWLYAWRRWHGFM